MSWAWKSFLPDGSLVHLGGKTLDTPGYDLAGVFVGSEGTLGVATKLFVRIVKRPECIRTLLAAFPSTNESRRGGERYHPRGNAASGDRNDGQPRDPGRGSRGPRELSSCGGLLLVELDGPVAEVEALSGAIVNEILPFEWRVGNSPGAVGRGTRARLERT